MARRRRRDEHSGNTTHGRLYSNRKFTPKGFNQQQYSELIEDKDIVLCSGPAGSGKTCVAVGMACKYLKEGLVDQILITRPVVEAGRGLGFLPGELEDKLNPYLVPVMEELRSYIHDVEEFIGEGKIIAEPLEYMRGRNFHKTFMILDEAQNVTFDQLKMFLTRIGNNSKCVLNGDVDQTDLTKDAGFSLCISRLANLDEVGIARLTKGDIIRNGIISKILEALED